MGILRTDKISGLETPTAVTGSVTFDGNDRLAITPTFPFEFGGSDFTIEMWVNMASTLSTVSTFFSKGNDNSVGTNFISLQTTGNNTTTAFFFRSGTALLSGPDLELNKWYHLAVTRSGDTFRFFVDGTLVDSDTDSNDLATGVTGGVNLGAQSFDLDADSRKFNGSLSNVRILKGTALYTEDFVPEYALEVVNDTILLCCNNPDSVTAASNAGIGTHITITTNGNPEVGTTNPSITRDFTYGTEFKGVTTFDTQGYFVPPSGTTEQRGRGRAVFAGGRTSPSVGASNIICFANIATIGNAQDFGDLTYEARGVGSCSSSTRGIFLGGADPALKTEIDFVTISTTGNAQVFNTLGTAKRNFEGLSNQTRGVFGAGQQPGSFPAALTSEMEFITIASTGSAIEFGNLSRDTLLVMPAASSTRGIFAGGYDGPSPANGVNTMEFITIASTGNATDFGDLFTGRYSGGGASSETRAVFAGGADGPATPGDMKDVIDYVTIASTGNALDFGNLLAVNENIRGTSNKIRGLFAGGYAANSTNVMQYITIASTGDAKDFGDLTSPLAQNGQCSDSHGGLP